MSKKYHYFYKITNKLNSHFYYGIHSTDNLNDNYMGSGKRLHAAYKKYGIANFTKEIVEFFSSREEAEAKEAEVVTKELVEDANCYNCILGGGNFNNAGLVCVTDGNSNFLVSVDNPDFASKKLKAANAGKLCGERNGMFGKRWIHKSNKEILVDCNELDLRISEGWQKGKLRTKPDSEMYHRKCTICGKPIINESKNKVHKHNCKPISKLKKFLIAYCDFKKEDFGNEKIFSKIEEIYKTIVEYAKSIDAKEISKKVGYSNHSLFQHVVDNFLELDFE